MLAFEHHLGATNANYSTIELSRSIKENHNSAILRVIRAPPIFTYANLAAVISAKQLNIYDTDALRQGHMDLLHHFSHIAEDKVFADCCWLWSEDDARLAILCNEQENKSSTVVYLLSLTYSSIIAKINLRHLATTITQLLPDSENCNQFYATDDQHRLHVFSFENAYEKGKVIDTQINWITESNGIILHTSVEQPSSLTAHDPFEYSQSVTSFCCAKAIEFAALKENSHVIIDTDGIVYVENEQLLTIPLHIWQERSMCDFDGGDLICIGTTQGTLHIFNLAFAGYEHLSFELVRSAAELTTIAFMSEADCCSQGVVPRILVGDSTGVLSLLRIS